MIRSGMYARYKYIQIRVLTCHQQKKQQQKPTENDINLILEVFRGIYSSRDLYIGMPIHDQKHSIHFIIIHPTGIIKTRVINVIGSRWFYSGARFIYTCKLKMRKFSEKSEKYKETQWSRLPVPIGVFFVFFTFFGNCTFYCGLLFITYETTCPCGFIADSDHDECYL
jgi:hypothetical protein